MAAENLAITRVPLEDMEESDIESFSKETLLMLAIRDGIQIHNKTAKKLRENLHKLRLHRIDLRTEREARPEREAAEVAEATAAKEAEASKQAYQDALDAAIQNDVFNEPPQSEEKEEVLDGSQDDVDGSQDASDGQDTSHHTHHDPFFNRTMDDDDLSAKVEAAINQQLRDNGLDLSQYSMINPPVTMAQVGCKLDVRDDLMRRFVVNTIKEEIQDHEEKMTAIINSSIEAKTNGIQECLEKCKETLEWNQNYISSLNGTDGATAERTQERVDEVVPPAPSARRSLLEHFSTGPNSSPNFSFRGHSINLSPIKEGHTTPLTKNVAAGGGHGGDDDDDSSHTTPDRSSRGSPEETAPTHPLLSRSTPTRPNNPYNRGISVAHSPLNSPNPIIRRMNNLYLCGQSGVADSKYMDMEFLTYLGFPMDIHEDIVASASELFTDWKTPVINPKYIDSLKSLDSLEPANFVDWYSHLRIDLPRYNIAVVPFDGIVLKWGALGLCLPGVGETKYMAMSQPFFSLLERLLPMSDPVVLQCYHAYGGIQHDGFKFLHSVMSRTLPVFCSALPAVPPDWTKLHDVSLMLKHWLLYFRFQSKTGSTQFDVFGVD